MFDLDRRQIVFALSLVAVVVLAFVGAIWMRSSVTPSTSAQHGAPAPVTPAQAQADNDRMNAVYAQLQCPTGGDPAAPACAQSWATLGSTVGQTVATWPADPALAPLRAAFVAVVETQAEFNRVVASADHQSSAGLPAAAQAEIAWRRAENTFYDRQLDVGLMTTSTHDSATAAANEGITRAQAVLTAHPAA